MCLSQIKGYYLSPRQLQKTDKLNKLRQTNARLVSQLKDVKKEKEDWIKEKEELKKEKENLMKERDAMKIQLSALNQGKITIEYLKHLFLSGLFFSLYF